MCNNIVYIFWTAYRGDNVKQEQKPKLIKTRSGWKCVGEKLEAYGETLTAYGSTPKEAYEMYKYLIAIPYYISTIPKDSMKWMLQGYGLFTPEHVDKQLFERAGAIRKFDAIDMPYKYSNNSL